MPRIKDYLKEPPLSGELEFSVFSRPVSLQSSRSQRDRIKRLIQKIVIPVEYLLSGDVRLEIQWIVPEKFRYESDSSPDIDNIIKPLLDALSGPRGIMIDDCQVQDVKCYWEDWEKPHQQINIKIIFEHDQWLTLDGLKFIHVQDGLCFPFPISIPDDTRQAYAKVLKTSMAVKHKLENNLEDYYRMKLILPYQRFYHRSKLFKFEIIDIGEVLK